MEYLPEFLIVALAHLLAVASPGPDFVMITRNALVYSRRVGVYSAVGLALGILVHVTYSLVGIGLLISQSVLLFSVIKLLGAAYLIYIGWLSLKAKPHAAAVHMNAERQSKEMGRSAAIRMGFLTNVLNPKATLFFLALFTQVISSATPKFVQVLYGLEMSFMTFLWFAGVASVLSVGPVRARFASIHHWAERAFGVILIALGLRVALSSAK